MKWLLNDRKIEVARTVPVYQRLQAVSDQKAGDGIGQNQRDHVMTRALVQRKEEADRPDSNAQPKIAKEFEEWIKPTVVPPDVDRPECGQVKFMEPVHSPRVPASGPLRSR